MTAVMRTTVRLAAAHNGWVLNHNPISWPSPTTHIGWVEPLPPTGHPADSQPWLGSAVDANFKGNLKSVCSHSCPYAMYPACGHSTTKSSNSVVYMSPQLGYF